MAHINLIGVSLKMGRDSVDIANELTEKGNIQFMRSLCSQNCQHYVLI